MSTPSLLESAVNIKPFQPKQIKPRKTGGIWLDACILDERGRVVPNLANVLLALRFAPELKDAVAYDEMLCARILQRALPVVTRCGVVVPGPLPRPVRDTDVSQLQEWLQWQGMPKAGADTTHQALDRRAQERAFHPVRDYLDGLKWDGVSRLDRWLVDYLGAEPSSYVARIGRMFLIAMIARIYKPGCKADYMLVLEGEQGAGKSRACRVLAGEWFSDDLPDLHSKDARQHLRGKWLIEVAELAAFKGKAAETLKAYVTRSDERYRPPFGRTEAFEPRQCLFVGTTNLETYLSDETGARRFWPVRVNRIDTKGLEAARDNLFAEAVAAYKGRERWWPDADFEREHIKPQQDARHDVDVWEEPIAEYLTTRERVTVLEVARNAMRIDADNKVTRADQNRIMNAMKRLGWGSGGRTGKARWYVPPVTE
jgi:predicted P-loop ATPase